MPNHIHGIVVIDGGVELTVEKRHVASLRLQKKAEFGPLKSGSLSTIIQAYKSAVTGLARHHAEVGFAWQPRFHDHSIRTERSLRAVRRYIRNNPLKWTLDKYHPGRKMVNLR